MGVYSLTLEPSWGEGGGQREPPSLSSNTFFQISSNKTADTITHSFREFVEASFEVIFGKHLDLYLKLGVKNI